MKDNWEKITRHMKNPNICLHCGDIYDNLKEIAVCDKCLDFYRENRKNGDPCGYLTVAQYLEEEEK